MQSLTPTLSLWERGMHGGGGGLHGGGGGLHDGRGGCTVGQGEHRNGPSPGNGASGSPVYLGITAGFGPMVWCRG